MPRFPLIADTDTTVSRRYGMLRHGTGPHADAHARSAFVIGPDKQIELSLSYPLTTGRNFWEILRVIDSLQLAARSRVATPANWQPGEDVVMRSVVDRAAATAVGAVS
jgi:alkyl hydroperoxide reductase subunit AhpC